MKGTKMKINGMAVVKGVQHKPEGILVTVLFAKHTIEADDLLQLGEMVGKKDICGGDEVDAVVDVTMGAVQEALQMGKTLRLNERVE